MKIESVALLEAELEVLKKVLRHNRYSGNGWFANESRKNVYLRDKKRFDELVRLESSIFNKIVGDEI